MDSDDRPPANGGALAAPGAASARTRMHETAATVVETHVLSQAERRRGLQSGPQQVEAAASAYSEREWSGPGDRRRRVGGVARKQV